MWSGRSSCLIDSNISLQTPGVYATVDFGPGTNVSNAFAVQRLFSPKGPLVNSEYYPGWLGWFLVNKKRRHVQTTGLTLTRQWTRFTQWRLWMPCSRWAPGAFPPLSVNIYKHFLSVNIYMFHGGTSFGFTAGSNYFHSNADGFQVTPTRSDSILMFLSLSSYDYDAPVSEAGDLTEKWWAIREVVGK